MNKNHHRLVFNPFRGCMMAVAETADTCGKSPTGTHNWDDLYLLQKLLNQYVENRKTVGQKHKNVNLALQRLNSKCGIFARRKIRVRSPTCISRKICERCILLAMTMLLERLSGGNSYPTASWIMKADDIAGLTPAQIASKFSLPAVPTEIGSVNIPAGIKLQASVANGILKGDNPGGGGVQFYIPLDKGKLPSNWFGSTRPLQ